jgi:hypothetical protein
MTNRRFAKGTTISYWQYAGAALSPWIALLLYDAEYLTMHGGRR